MLQDKKILTGLNPTLYEHDFDKKALEKLKDVPHLEDVLSFITKHAIERVYSIQYKGSNLRVSEKEEKYKDIYKYLQRACEILDIGEIPELYIKWDYTIDAETYGSQNPIMVLNSGVIDLCSDDEIMFLIGHELGHIKSDHMLYHMAAEILGLILDYVPFFGKTSQLALYYWDRMSDLTADRAGLLCCQNEEAMISSLMKMAGLPLKGYNSINTDSFIEQADEFGKTSDIDAEIERMLADDNENATEPTESNGLFGSVKSILKTGTDKVKGIVDADFEEKLIKMISIAGSREPWTVMRASELRKWVKSGNYGKIIG